MNEFQTWKNRSRQHESEAHKLKFFDAIFDPTCKICYPVTKEATEQFTKFWAWYREIVPAKDYSGYTLEIFKQTLVELSQETRSKRPKLGQLIESVEYYRRPNLTLLQIKSEIITIFVASKGFTLSNEETSVNYQELVKSRSNSNSDENKEDSPEEQSSPEPKSPELQEEISSKKEDQLFKLGEELEQILREFTSIINEEEESDNSRGEIFETDSNSENNTEDNTEEEIVINPEELREEELIAQSDTSTETNSENEEENQEENNMAQQPNNDPINGNQMLWLFQNYFGVDGANLTAITNMAQETRDAVNNLTTA
jgi:flagellar biosynthesis GTPase FlhF